MGKVNNHTPVVVGRKSDRLIVPEKQPNKAGLPVAEAVEESGLTKRNAQQDVGGRTQGRNSTSSNLLGIRQAAAKVIHGRSSGLASNTRGRSRMH